MGMLGMMRGPDAEMPDTYGLPIYRIDRTIMQRVGDEIHILCGAEMFGQVKWSHIEIIKAPAALVESRKCHDLAVEAFNESQMAAGVAH